MVSDKVIPCSFLTCLCVFVIGYLMIACLCYPQALYELAFGFGSISAPFFIYTLRPRTRVPCDVNISDVGEPPQVLFVEETDDGVDLLKVITVIIFLDIPKYLACLAAVIYGENYQPFGLIPIALHFVQDTAPAKVSVDKSENCIVAKGNL